MIRTIRSSLAAAGLTLLAIAVMPPATHGCTGITLKAQDGTFVNGRTMEWGAFDLNSRVVAYPRGKEFVGLTPDGQNGMRWTARYGVAGIDMLEDDVIADGMNEHGLTLGLFYHPGFAEYAPYDPKLADKSMAPNDVSQYLLTTCATTAEVRKAIMDVHVVPYVEPTLGFPAPVHFKVTDPTGDQIVIEFVNGKTVIHDAPLGVITNAPTYDWHLTNLRNYLNLSAVALPDRSIEDLNFAPLGGGSGMIGLPGDFTPPSRFVRAVAFTQSARPTKDGPETIYEGFRILDNFDVPLGAAEGSDAEEDGTVGMRSSTVWTVLHDTRNKVMYYHTQHNRRVRMLDVGAIDFDSLSESIRLPLDIRKQQDIETIEMPTSGTQTYTEADADSRITVSNGDVFRVSLAANPSTGYTWKATGFDARIIEQMGDPGFSSDSDAIGAGGRQTFEFRATGAGSARITFAYQRPWEAGEAPARKITMTFLVR